MNPEPDALALLAAQASRDDADRAPDPRPEELLPTSLAPIYGEGISS